MISDRQRTLMHEHQQDADIILNEEWQSEIPANAFYFVGFIVGSFVIVLLLLVIFAR